MIVRGGLRAFRGDTRPIRYVHVSKPLVRVKCDDGDMMIPAPGRGRTFYTNGWARPGKNHVDRRVYRTP